MAAMSFPEIFSLPVHDHIYQTSFHLLWFLPSRLVYISSLKLSRTKPFNYKLITRDDEIAVRSKNDLEMLSRKGDQAGIFVVAR